MMLLACLYCKNGQMVPTYKDQIDTVTYHTLLDPTIELHGFICRRCGWYAEFDSSKIIDRDGTYGFKDT